MKTIKKIKCAVDEIANRCKNKPNEAQYGIFDMESFYRIIDILLDKPDSGASGKLGKNAEMLVRRTYSKIGSLEEGMIDDEQVYSDTVFASFGKYDPEKAESFFNFFMYLLYYKYLDEAKITVSKATVSLDEEYGDEEAEGSSLYERLDTGKNAISPDTSWEDPVAAAVIGKDDAIDIKVMEFLSDLITFLSDQTVKCVKIENRDRRLTKRFVRNCRMFFTNDFLRICIDELDFYGIHIHNIWDNLDTILLDCVYEKRPYNVKQVIEQKRRKFGDLVKKYNGTEAQKDYEHIFISKNTNTWFCPLENEINVPVENCIFIADCFIDEYSRSGMIPKAKKDSSLSRDKSDYAFIKRMVYN